jgi:hypothetical protein
VPILQPCSVFDRLAVVLVLAAVLTESWLETGAVPDTVTVAGLKLQLLFAGSPEQAKVT